MLVIDNLSTDVPLKNKYGELPFVMHKLFVQYLRMVDHPKAEMMAQQQPLRYIMKWCSEENKIDCGIFTMRHMEEYGGEDITKWDCGFNIHQITQKRQIFRLRYKYATKLLLSEQNLQREKVLMELNEFDSFDESKKKYLEDLAKTLMKERQEML